MKKNLSCGSNCGDWESRSTPRILCMTAVDDPRELLIEIVKILDKLHIQYMVTGGLAVFVWGKPRFTADVDMVIELVRPKVDALADALQKVEEAGYVDRDAMIDALRRRGEFNFISPSMGLKVDFWVVKDDPIAKHEFARRKIKQILGNDIFFIAPEDLILSKLRWYQKGGGERHLEDSRSVIGMMGKRLDYKYIEQSVEQQSLREPYQSLFQ